MAKNKTYSLNFVRFICCLLILSFASGCATYKILESSDYDGYVYSRSANVIPEYTTDGDAKAPADKDLAKTRFKRRCKKVEHYYRHMGYIKGVAVSYLEFIRIFLFSPVLSPLIVPIHIYQQHRYYNNPEYRAMVDKQDEKDEEMRRRKVKQMKEDLKKYIEEDMIHEGLQNPDKEVF